MGYIRVSDFRGLRVMRVIELDGNIGELQSNIIRYGDNY